MSIFLSKQLKYFMVAMELKCISKAADALCITRTPLCKKLIDIEKSLNKKLFVRSYNQLTPTDIATSLHKELLPLYESHLKIEKKLASRHCEAVLEIIFDITMPEMLYRTISSFIQGELPNRKLKFKRTLISEDILNKNAREENTIFISVRQLTFVPLYTVCTLHGSEVSILMPKHHLQSKDSISFYVWNDNYLDYFKERVKTVLNEEYSTINFIEHNQEFTSIVSRIYQGYGACILPLKSAMMYRNEKLHTKVIKGKYISVYLYYIDNNSLRNEVNITKQTITSVI